MYLSDQSQHLLKFLHYRLKVIILHSVFRGEEAQILALQSGCYYSQGFLDLLLDGFRARCARENGAFIGAAELTNASLSAKSAAPPLLVL